jgi:hypothetical protein
MPDYHDAKHDQFLGLSTDKAAPIAVAMRVSIEDLKSFRWA